MLKKILKISAILLVVIFLLAFSLPFFFRHKITALARDQINKHINAKVDFSDVDLSMFRHFPRLSVGLNNLQVVGTDDFNKDTLISAGQVDVALNLFSLFGGYQIDIYNISIDKPRIHAIVNKDGKANWDISKPDTSGSSTNTSSNFRMHLQSYKINEGYISYTDVPSDMYCEIQNLNHSGAGDFTSDLFTLQTKTSIESVSFTRNKIPWLV
ncbi:MAG TPA: AsmA family protein, partial [Puia sp.]